MTESADTVDYARYDLGAVRVKLRPDVTLRSGRFGGADCVVIEDAVRSRFFRLGPAEAVFASLLDGEITVSEAVAETASVVDGSPLTETRAGVFCAWLVENGLAATPQSRSESRLLAAAEQEDRRSRRERVNPVMVKTPLGRPDTALSWLSDVAGWLFGPLGAAAWLLVVGWAAVTAWTHSGRLAATAATVGVHDWPAFLAAAGLLKLLHELGHGVACRRLGCEVRECGVLWLLLMPLPYVDVTASWRLGSKWHRSLVAAAGMFVELFVAAAAVLVWDASGSPVVRHHALNVALTASVITLLFNANPLMRFDGYYILSDLLELPNLSGHGQLAVRRFARRLVFGQAGKSPTWPEGRGWVVHSYGVAAFLWRVLICVSLTLAAERLYHGAGIVLAAASVCIWVLAPAGRLFAAVLKPDPAAPINRRHFACVVAVAGLAAYGVLDHVRWTSRLRLPAVVEHTPVRHARAGSAGFVEAVHVAGSETVHAGQRLITLRDDALSAEARRTEIALRRSRLDQTRYLRQGNPSAAAVERENESALRVRLEELRDRVEDLIVRAPSDGRVLTAKPDELAGRWAAAGTPLLEVGPVEGPAVRFYVPQEDAAAVRSRSDEPFRLRIWGVAKPVEGRMADLSPRASRDVSSPRLTATAGGPLDVVRSTDSGDDWRLVRPHFVGRLNVDPEDLNRVGIGQTGFVEIDVRSRTIREAVTAAVTRRWAERSVAR